MPAAGPLRSSTISGLALEEHRQTGTPTTRTRTSERCAERATGERRLLWTAEGGLAPVSVAFQRRVSWGPSSRGNENPRFFAAGPVFSPPLEVSGAEVVPDSGARKSNERWDDALQEVASFLYSGLPIPDQKESGRDSQREQNDQRYS